MAALNQTHAEAELDVIQWSHTLTVISAIILAVGLPLASLTFASAAKAALAKGATLFEWVIALLCFGLLQLCCFGQVGNLVRMASHFRENINIPVSCLVNQISTEFAATLFHTGLFASIIVRYIYVLHPQTGETINQRPKMYKFIATTLIIGFALMRCLSEYFYSETSIYRFCVIDIITPFKDVLSVSNNYYMWTLVLVVVAVDLVLTVRTYWFLNSSNRQVQTSSNTPGNRNAKPFALLSMTGTIYCRFAGILVYLSFFFVQRFAPEESLPLRDHFLAAIGQLFAFACLTILAPIAFITNSNFVRKWLLKQN